MAMDYMFLTQGSLRLTQLKDPEKDKAEGENDEEEDAGDARGARHVLTPFVVKDFNGDAILNYPVNATGLGSGAWLVQPLMDDLDTLGMNGHQFAVMCDQESSGVEIQKEMVTRRIADGGRKTIAENSRLGD